MNESINQSIAQRYNRSNNHNAMVRNNNPDSCTMQLTSYDDILYYDDSKNVVRSEASYRYRVGS